MDCGPLVREGCVCRERRARGRNKDGAAAEETQVRLRGFPAVCSRPWSLPTALGSYGGPVAWDLTGPYLPSKPAVGAGAQSTLSRGNLPPRPPALASHRLNCVPHTRTAVPGRLPRESCPWPCGEGGGWLRPVGGGSEPLCCVAQTCDLPPEGGDPALELEVSERQPSNTGWELELREAVRDFTFAPPVSELAVSPEGLCLTCPGSRLLCSSLHPLPGFLSCSLGNSQRLLPGSSGLHPPSLSTI